MSKHHATVDNLNSLIETNSAFQVHDDDTVTTYLPDVYAPDVYGDTATGTEYLEDDDWEFFSDGYTGQYSASGPGMHDSETLSGGLARDILDTPGVYAVVAVYWPDGDDGEGDFEGWVVVRRA